MANATSIDGVDLVVEKTLSLFKSYDIHATWAMVGLLHYNSIKELKRDNVGKVIPYKNALFSPFPLDEEKYLSFNPKLLLAKQSIEKILATNFQELASHTFSHLYCCEEGVAIADFEEDCQRMQTIGKEMNHHFSSIVFPRNQINDDALAVSNSFGITCYRGNQENKFWINSSYNEESLLKKVGRVSDAYFKNSKTKAYAISELKREKGLLNIPANRFFRPPTSYGILERQKVKRIKREMHTAAKNGQVYHLWWHPHNFSNKLDQALSQMEEIFLHYQMLNKKFGFQSLNMLEITENAAK